MSERIAQLLDEPERAVKKLISRLEDKNGYPSHDARHLAKNIQHVRRKVIQLGLDPDDTTAEELHQALLIKYKNDSRRFDEHFGTHLRTYDEKINKAIELVSTNNELPERWVLKNQIAKSLLRQHLPKRVMKQLNYRSIDSLLKHEDIAEIYLAVGFMESAAWNKDHTKLVSSEDSTAFESRKLKITPLKLTKWGPGTDINVLFSNDYGALGLEPSESLEQAGLLTLTVLLLDGLAGFTGASLAGVAKFSPAAAWWAETEGLIASMAGGEVSLSIRDTAENHSLNYDFASRTLASARQAFWRQLQSRYQNRLAPEEDLLMNFSQARLAAGPTFQPAFEYEEATDG